MRWFRSPAKINRFLYIKARLPNGYHEIVTLFEKVAFFDEIGIELRENGRPGIEISCPDWVPSGPENLVYKAIEGFMEASGLSFRAYVELKKQIPSGAGLGGGSSNCGTTLKALNAMLGEPLSTKGLFEIASLIGADCPFFISDWTHALGKGTGTELEEVVLEPNWYLLVLPDFSVDTGWAYKNFKLTRQGDETIFEPRKGHWDYEWRNDLERPVCARFPAISRVKSSLLDSGASIALMSGSGSTCFGVFDSRERALDARNKVERETGYKCLITKTLDRE